MLEDHFARGRSSWRRVAVTVGFAIRFALGFAIVGCGSATTSPPAAGAGQVVKGKVLLASGKPCTKGRIALFPKEASTLPLYGTLEPDGSYTLKAGGLLIGVTHGEFLVSIEPNGYVPGSSKPKSLAFPAKYLSPENGLTVSINAETKELPLIELK